MSNPDISSYPLAGTDDRIVRVRYDDDEPITFRTPDYEVWEGPAMPESRLSEARHVARKFEKDR